MHDDDALSATYKPTLLLMKAEALARVGGRDNAMNAQAALNEVISATRATGSVGQHISPAHLYAHD